MKTMFKKSLVALALTGAAMSVMADPSVTGPTSGKTFALEGLQTIVSTGTAIANVHLGTSANTVAPIVTFGDAVATDGLIRISFNADFTTGTQAFAVPATLTTVGGVTLNLANSGSNFAVYRVAAPGVVANDTVALTFAKFPFKTVAALKELTVALATETSLGAEIGATEEPVVLASIERQGTATLTQKLAGTIDVAQQRVAFTSGSYEQLETDFADNAKDAYNVVYKASTHVVTGDFSFIKDIDANTVDIQPANGVVDVNGCTLNYVKASELKATCAAGTDFELGFDLDANTASAPNADVETTLIETAFTLTSSYDFSNALGLASNAYKPFQATAAGSWILNGSNVQVPYMVFGTVGGKEFSQVININNASSIAGDIYVDVYDAAGTALVKNKKLTVKAAANSVTSIAGEIKALISAYNGRASVKIVTETPSASTQVYAAYVDNVTTERAIVVGIK